jgi:hypothetical protein
VYADLCYASGGHSSYNDDRGIQYEVQFFLKTRPKRKGGCDTVESTAGTRTCYVHESAGTPEVFRSCLALHKKDAWMDDFPGHLSLEDEYPTENFVVEGGVPNRRKASLMETDVDFKAVKDLATKGTETPIIRLIFKAAKIEQEVEAEEQTQRAAAGRRVRRSPPPPYSASLMQTARKLRRQSVSRTIASSRSSVVITATTPPARTAATSALS